MPKVKNTQRFPLDVEIKDHDNLHLGPKGSPLAVSRELSEDEIASEAVQRYLANGFLIEVQEQEAAEGKTKKTAAAAKAEDSGKDGDK